MVSCFKGRFRLTSPRGWRVLNGANDYHGGIDLVGLDDTTVYSICDGTVRTAYQANGAGNYVVITMNDGRRVFYMHLASFAVTNGQSIKKGQPIGVMGNTGNSFGAHTHLELRIPGTSGESLDICEYTGIPNTTGIYEYKEEAMEHFNDIKGNFAEQDINELCEMGIINGNGNGAFEPDRPPTRAEVAAMLRRTIRFITGK